MSESREENLRKLNIIERQNRRIILFRTYQLGKIIMESYLRLRSYEDFENIVALETERMAVKYDVFSAIPMMKIGIEEHDLELNNLDDVIVANEKTLIEINKMKIGKSYVDFINNYKGDRFLYTNYTEDDGDDSFIEDFLE